MDHTSATFGPHLGCFGPHPFVCWLRGAGFREVWSVCVQVWSERAHVWSAAAERADAHRCDECGLTESQRVGHGAGERVEAHVVMLERQAQPVCRRLAEGRELRVVALRQQEHPGVVAEVHVP